MAAPPTAARTGGAEYDSTMSSFKAESPLSPSLESPLESSSSTGIGANFTAEELEYFFLSTDTSSSSSNIEAGMRTPISTPPTTAAAVHLPLDPGDIDFGSEDENESEMSASARRTRRTEIERMSRRRRQSSLKEMRAEAKTLEDHFESLLADHAVHKKTQRWRYQHMLLDRDTVPSLYEEEQYAKDVKLGESYYQLREEFIELKLMENELKTEQRDLDRMLRGKQLLAMSVQSLSMSFVRNWTSPQQQSSGPNAQPILQPASTEEYFACMRAAYEELTTLDETAPFQSTGNNCMGWVDRHFADAKRNVFSMTKTFAGRDPELIMLDTWDIFTSESRLRQSFGAWGTSVRLQVVDQPNDDMVVIHRRSAHMHCPQKEHHVVFVLFRVRTATGFTICMRSMKSLQVPMETRGAKWIGMFTWLHFRQPSDGSASCEVVYNNYVPSPLRRPLPDTFIMFLTTVVRWESACLAPQLLVSS